VQDRYQLSFWDALIVAAAKSHACRYLLTEDLQANQEHQELDGITVVICFFATLLPSCQVITNGLMWSHPTYWVHVAV